MKVITNILLLAVLLTHVACSDIFEESIEGKQVNIIAPGDSVESPIYGVTFWWNPLDGALKYNLQIAAPDFNNITVLVLDTMVSSTKFIYSLDPGIYQWRIRAENGSSKTPYTTRVIRVDTSGLSSQTVFSTLPIAGAFFNSTSVSFNWHSLYGTTAYILEVDTITGNFSSPLKWTQSTPYNGCTYLFNTNGRFHWRVKATNSTQVSGFSTVKEFTIDTQAPAVVSNMSSPSQAKPILLAWDASTSADVVTHKLFVYKVGISDTTIFSQTYNPKVITSGTSFSFNDGVSGDKIIWRVKTVDRAGNESAFSPYGSFTIGF